jgi:hypothetical protein
MNLPMKSQSTFHGYGIFLVIHLICFSFIRRICEVLQTSSTAKPLKESTAFRAKSSVEFEYRVYEIQSRL